MRHCPCPRPVSIVAACLGLLTLAGLAGCASAPPPAAPVITYEQKMAWVLRLEDQRLLRDPAPPAVAPPQGGKRRVLPPPPPVGDLLRLMQDEEARVRRRAALAVGRVGLGEGVEPLTQALAHDAEPEVRQMAAFALGLIGDRQAAPALRAALADTSVLVQGRAAEALGSLGDRSHAPAIAALASSIVRAGVLKAVPPDALDATQEPSVQAFRLAVYALGRLESYEALASAVLAPNGEPLVRWWPVAAALQRTQDRRALVPLMAFARSDNRVARAFAAKGLGALKDPAAVDLLVAMAQGWTNDLPSAVSAVRALGQIGDRRAAPALVALLQTRSLDQGFWLEVIAACGAVRAEGAVEGLLDLMAHRSPAVRAAALRSLQAIDDQAFLRVLSGLDPDPHWSVRAALASIVAGFDVDRAAPRLTAMLADRDQRVIPAVLSGLARVRAPGAEKILFDWITRDDPVVRMAAADAIGALKPAGGDRVLAEAYRAGQRDGTYVARAAALAALAKYGREAVLAVAGSALADKDYAIRIRAAAILKDLEPSRDTAHAIRPAPTRHAPEFYASADLVSPAFSPHAFIETDRGTVELELAVLDAPLTCESFVALARRGYFNGVELHRVVPNFVVQDGDPRGDGEGGPGYTLRDEFNQRPYLRGTVGMALDGPETGGSQFFITHSPQPHLDARYTVFGTVVAGMDVVDRLQAGDVIRRVRVWDGRAWIGQ